MEINEVTVGIAVTDLERSRRWYRTVFELGEADIEIAEDLEEYELGPVWLQLSEEEGTVAQQQTVVRFGVDDVDAEHDRLAELGFDVGEVEEFGGMIAFFEFSDPDGNLLSLYTILESD